MMPSELRAQNEIGDSWAAALGMHAHPRPSPAGLSHTHFGSMLHRAASLLPPFLHAFGQDVRVDSLCSNNRPAKGSHTPQRTPRA